MDSKASTGRPWPQYAVLAFITVAALAVRIYYVHTAVVEHPFQGDAGQYVTYALNLVDRHTFSAQPPQAPATADSFRDPGYVAFLAALMSMFGHGQALYKSILDIQCVLSSLTVGIYALLARQWLGAPWGAAAGIALAIWPPSVVFSGYVLTETLLGFLVASALVLLQATFDRRRTALAIAAGLTCAAAALTNAVLMPLSPVLAVFAAWKDPGRRRVWMIVFLAATIPCATWLLRSASLPPGQNSGDRVALNFVQGSWPEYHAAWFDSVVRHQRSADLVIHAIEADNQAMYDNRSTGMVRIASRMAAQPVRYLGWYLSKPAELWGWSVGLGAGGIYVYWTSNSPFAAGPLKAITDAAVAINGLLAIVAFGGVVVVFRKRGVSPVFRIAAIAVVFVTVVYAILQSDARYAIPYRGIEWLLALAMVSFCANWLKIRRKSALADGHSPRNQ